jgi:hypothetical protein
LLNAVAVIITKLKIKNTLMEKNILELYPVEKRPSRKDPDGDGWSVDIILISGEKEFTGYYDPKGSIAGGKYFYYEKGKIVDCALLKPFPTNWKYV